MIEGIGRVPAQYIGNRGVCVADKKREKSNVTEMMNRQNNAISQMKIIHTAPKMTEIEKERAQKDLYEVFSRIKIQLKI